MVKTTYIPGVAGGNIKKQLDYIIISNKRKNWVNNAGTKGTANINNIYRRNITQMDITMKLKKITNDTDKGKHINFNLDNMRCGPQLLEVNETKTKRHYQNGQK